MSGAVRRSILGAKAAFDRGFARLFAVAALVSAVTLAACGGDFDPGSRVTDLRVLAVRADAPYAAPGQTVHLDALAVDPAARTLTWGWALCTNPASPTAQGCLAELDRSTVVIERGKSTFDWTLSSDVITSLPAAAASKASVGVVVVACPGDLTTSDGPVPFRCHAPGGRMLATHEYVVGVKRIFARTTDTNGNPILDGVTWDGAEWPAAEIKDVVPCGESGNDYGACSPHNQHLIKVSVPESSTESGVDSFGAPFHEQVVVQYYASEGIFEHDVRLAGDSTTGWTARRESAGRTVTMWFIVRDDRGGVAWTERQVRVAGP